MQEARRLDGELDRGPQHVEIGEMHDLAVEIGAPVAVDDLRQEQARDQEEVRHPERLGEGDDGMHPAFLAERLLDAERRMHHHHEDDAEALGVVDPVDALPACGAEAVIGVPFRFPFVSYTDADVALPLPIQRGCQ